MNMHNAVPLVQSETGALVAGYEPLPAGEYSLEIVESDYVPTVDGLGLILKTKCQIIVGEFDLRPYYINFILEYRDEARQEIGQRDFAGLRRATGVLAPDDSEQLHFKPFSVKIGVSEDGCSKTIKEYIFDRGDALAA